MKIPLLFMAFSSLKTDYLGQKSDSFSNDFQSTMTKLETPRKYLAIFSNNLYKKSGILHT